MPLDDCLYALQAVIPTLSRSSLHRCFQRHGISRRPPDDEGTPSKKAPFKDDPLGYLPLDFAEVQTEEGKLYLLVAIDRTSKLAFAELHAQQLCDAWGIEQRFTKPAHPWTNGQVERMNRTLKEATIKRFHYETTAQLNNHLQAFLHAYNFAKRLKRLNGLTPYEFICADWRKNPSLFHRDPADLTMGPYS